MSTTATLLSRDEVGQIVRQTIVREAGLQISPDLLTDDTGLVSDIVQIDSMTFIRCLIGVEEELNSTFGDDLLMQTGFKTVGNLINRIYAAYEAAS